MASIERSTADVGARAAAIQSTNAATRATGCEIEHPKPIQSMDRRTETFVDYIHLSGHCDSHHRHQQWRVVTLLLLIPCMIKNEPPNTALEPTPTAP